MKGTRNRTEYLDENRIGNINEARKNMTTGGIIPSVSAGRERVKRCPQCSESDDIQAGNAPEMTNVQSGNIEPEL